MAGVGSSAAREAQRQARAARSVRRWAIANRAALLALMDQVEQQPVLPPDFRNLEQAINRRMRTAILKATARGCLMALTYDPRFVRFFMRRYQADPQGMLRDKNPIPSRQPRYPSLALRRTSCPTRQT